MTTTPTSVSPELTAPHTMQCTEVWGGNELVERGVVMAGLDAWVFSRPFEGDIEGGDIHYLSSCATGRITRALIADVSGHGAVVSGTAVRLRALMRRYMNYVNQSRLVEGINKEFAGLAQAGHFATAVVATYWSPTREVELTSAGHPTPLLYRAATKRWGALGGGVADGADEGGGPSDIPLGIDDIATYARSSATLEPGDLLLMYTDALIEARTAQGRLLGVQGLIDVLGTLDVAGPETLISRLLGAIAAQTPQAELGTLADDTTLMLLRLNDLRPRASIGAGLRAGVRVAAEFFKSLRRGEVPPMPEARVDNLGGVFSERLGRRGQKGDRRGV